MKTGLRTPPKPAFRPSKGKGKAKQGLRGAATSC